MEYDVARGGVEQVAQYARYGVEPKLVNGKVRRL